VKLTTNVHVHAIPEVKSRGLASYYFLNAYNHYKAVRRIIRDNDIDAVVLSNLLAGYVALKAVGDKAKTIFDLSDHFPSLGAGYYFQVNTVLGKAATSLLEQILKKTMKNVDHTTTCSHTLRDYVNHMGISNSSIIGNGVADFFFESNDGGLVRKQYDLNDSTIVGYIGSMEFWLDILPLLKAIQRLKGEQNLKLVLIGSKLRTTTAQVVRNYIKMLGIEDNIVWLDFIPYREVPNFIGAMDICTIPFNHNHPTAYYSAPNKLLEYFAVGKTVISTPIPEVVRLAKSCANFALTTEDYVAVFKDYARNIDAYREKAKQGKQLAKQMTWSKMARRYETLLYAVNSN
jgi:glycosyltransferase involved in cell wall biosynthesis